MRGSLAGLGSDSSFCGSRSDLIFCVMCKYEHIKAHEWEMMAAKWLSEELVNVGISINAHEMVPCETIFPPLDASTFSSKAVETLEPQIKPLHCRNASLVADFGHDAPENVTLFYLIFKPV